MILILTASDSAYPKTSITGLWSFFQCLAGNMQDGFGNIEVGTSMVSDKNSQRRCGHMCVLQLYIIFISLMPTKRKDAKVTTLKNHEFADSC